MTMPTTAVLALTRSAIGASGWLMPITAGRLFGMDVSNDVSAALFLRLGGSRDFALAASPLVAGESRKQMLKLAAACDIGDIVAVAIARRRGKLSKSSAALFTVASLACLGLTGKAIAEQ
ncbi:hypothetical protein BOO86_15430 [Mycobacterium sp. CBMA 234]|uniref:hypothetical protein n=1 Tax=Mycolicibacterium sp. CBMA 234 TaxID=1918495 RepID=UPI0012DE605D|nr:hypothetical protein [Mycolicibacterium sp. CBMA 234]MUL65866.1 hypothetical protein [Mycolicibacterium sp. CBMA 234]